MFPRVTENRTMKNSIKSQPTETAKNTEKEQKISNEKTIKLNGRVNTFYARRWRSDTYHDYVYTLAQP